MKKFIINGLVYSVLITVLLNLFALLVFEAHKASKFYKPSFIANTIQDQNYDYIILGSSMGLTSINTILVDEFTGLKGLNASMDDTSFASHYLMLRHFVENLGNTKKCFVAINPSDISNPSPSYSTNDYRFIPFIHKPHVFEELNKREEGINPLKISYYQPFVATSYYNVELTATALQALIFPEKRNRFDEKGNFSYPVAGTPPNNKFNQETLLWKNPYIDLMERLAKENGIELIYYQPPIYNTKVINNDSSKSFLNHSDALGKASFFYDKIHVNKFGREQISIKFAEDLVRL